MTLNIRGIIDGQEKGLVFQNSGMTGDSEDCVAMGQG